MDTNLISLVIAVIGSIGGLILSLFSKISELKSRLDTLPSNNHLYKQEEKIYDNFGIN